MSNQEIERKFLVKGNFKKFAVEHFDVIQGYLSRAPKRSVRVRIIEEKAFLTIKGIGNANGTTRYEWEKKIDLSDAKDLLRICKRGIIKKTRYIIPANDNLFFEVDLFKGKNKGLVVAEIELPTENAFFKKPNWLGKEVTGNKRYYNAMLAKNPFKEWL